MPTGYTADVKDGKISTLNEYAWLCTRAFGAMIHMRDDGHGEEIRYRDASSYHQEALAKATERLSKARAMTTSLAKARMDAKYDADMYEYEERLERLKKERERYEDMISQVEAWNPPTDNHVKLKDFMLSQLKKSLELDCDGMEKHIEPPTKMSGREYIKKEIEQAKKDIEYHTQALENENNSMRLANEWIDDLHNSLPCPDHLKGF